MAELRYPLAELDGTGRDKSALTWIDFFAKTGYFIESLAISKFLTRRGMCLNGNYLYGGLVLKLNSRHMRKKRENARIIWYAVQSNLS
ncbi:hypothetical protein [Paenibacillus segetis]|uniref:hypothetical protein n=1 Tax=Paenibacillus segetis TaxID=1325360 RepID=UPI001886FC3D|nr:hypothetical protein [Paenibacillus segetis]